MVGFAGAAEELKGASECVALSKARPNLMPCRVFVNAETKIDFPDCYQAIVMTDGALKIVGDDGGCLGCFTAGSWRYFIPLPGMA